jgi:hypothetical protein
MGVTGRGRRVLSVISVLSVVSVLSSCHKLQALAGGGQASSQPAPTKITGYEDGQEVNVNPGPPSTPSHAGGDQGWHVQPLKCGVEDRLLGMCGNPSSSSSHSSVYVPSYATPQVSPFYQHYGPTHSAPQASPFHVHYGNRSRSHY